MSFLSVKEMLSGAAEAGLPLWQYVQQTSADEAGISCEKSWEMMALRLEAMKEADAGYNPAMRSRSGLVGGDGGRMLSYANSGKSIAGDFVGGIISAVATRRKAALKSFQRSTRSRLRISSRERQALCFTLCGRCRICGVSG